VLPPATSPSVTEVNAISSSGAIAYTSSVLSAEVTGLQPANSGVVYNWQVDDSPIKVLHMPFDLDVIAEGGSVRNYAGPKNGTIDGVVHKSTGGYNGGGYYYFNANSSIIIDDDAANITAGESFTYVAWVYPEDHNDHRTIIGRVINHAPHYHQFLLMKNTGYLGYYTVGETERLVSTTVVPLNTWSHVAAVYDKPNNKLRLFFNGVEVAEKTTAAVTFPQMPYDMLIGKFDVPGHPQAFKGGIDDVMIFNRPLSNEQIALMYNNYSVTNEYFNYKISPKETASEQKWKVCAIPYNNTGVGSEKCSNELLIKFPQITGTTINSGNTEALSSDNLLQTTTPDFGNGAKMISDWQVDKGSGFESIKIVDMPFDGGDFNASGRIVDYISGIESYLNSNITYESGLGFDGKGCYKFNSSSIQLHNDVRDKIISLSGNSQTISLWIKTESNGKIYSYYGCSIGDNTTYYLDLVNNKLLFFIADSDGNESILEYTNGLSLMDGSWHNIVTTYKVGGDQEIYVDGDLIASKPMGTFNGFTNSESIEFNLGARKHCNNSSIQPFDGYIDDFKVYKRALSQQQIEAMFNNCLNPDGSYNGNFRDNIIAPQETKTGEKWRVTVTPNDNVNNGEVKTSNEVLIKFPQITGVTINDGAAEAFGGNNLLHTTGPDFGNRAKMISDWQVDNGSGFESIKIIDMPMDGGALAAGNVKNYISNNHGVILEASYKSGEGFDGKGCYEFDGINDGIYIEDSDIIDLTDDFTISLWINPAHIHGPEGSKAGVILRKDDAYEIYFCNKKINLRIHTPDLTENVIDYNLELNRWTYLTMTYKDRVLKGYINGVLKSSEIYPANLRVNSNNLCFGRYNNGSFPYTGKLDEVKFFNRALSGSQIAAMYNNCLNQDGTYNGNFRDNIIAPQETKTGEKWRVTVTPNDNVNNGEVKTSNEVLIKFPQITGVTINDGAAEAFGGNNLLHTTNPDFGNGAKMISDWQVDNGSGFKSLKILDMPMDGGALEGGKVKNYSGNIHGTILGGGYKSDGGFDGKGCFEFDGIDDGIYIEDNDIIDLANDFTISLWVNPAYIHGPEGSKAGVILRKGDAYELFYSNGIINLRIHTPNFNQNTIDYNVDINRWSFVTVTYKDGVLKGYINGVQRSSNTYSGNIKENTNNLCFGRYNVGSFPFKGKLDEIKIFNRALSSSQIEAMYNDCLNPDGSYNGNFRDNIIAPQETKTGEKWRVTVIPNDNENNGEVKTSNEVLIKFSQINQVQINNGDTEASTIVDLIYTTAPDFGNSVKMITDWQVDKDDGNGFQSIKILDMPMDGGALAGEDVKNYVSDNNGVVNGAEYKYDSGFDNKGCYYFNGTSNHIAVADNTEKRTDGSFTATVWVYMTGGQEYAAFITAESTERHYSWTLRKYKENNKIEFAIANRNNPSNNDYTSTFSTDDIIFNKWQHVVVVWNQDKKSATLYLNGEESGGSNISNISRYTHDEGFSIGKSNFVTTTHFKGFLDDVKVYNRALSPEQISAMYNNFETTRIYRDDIIVPQETKSGEVWKTCVAPNDNSADGTELCSNSVTIAIPAIENLKINEGDSEAINSEKLIAEYDDIQNIKGFFNWQVDKNDGNGFQSIKVFDMPMDGGALAAGGKIKDYANDNHATPSGAIYQPDGGYDGKGAYYLNGSSYISIPHSSNVDIGSMQEYTVNFWVYLYNTSGGYIASKGNANSVNMWFIQMSDKSVELRFRDYGTSDDLHMFSVSNLPSKTGWVNVAISYDSEGKYKIYRDGVKVGESVTGKPKIRSNSSFIRLGGRCHNSNCYHTELKFDEFEIYNRALSETQIAVMYNNYEATGAACKDTIVPQETKIGEKWKLEVTPNDNIDDGISVLSNEIEIIFPQINQVQINNGDTKTTSANRLEYNTIPDFGTDAKLIADWQVKKDTDSDFESVKAFDMPMDGGTLASGKVKEYMNGINGVVASSGVEYLPNGGIDGKGAYYFDGTNKTIDIGDKDDFNFILSTRTFTISFWAKTPDYVGRHLYIMGSAAYTSSTVGFYMGIDENGKFAMAGLKASSGENVFRYDFDPSDPRVFPDDEFHHIVVTCDDSSLGTDEFIKYYVDGELKGQGGYATSDTYTGNSTHVLGLGKITGYTPTGNRSFKGVIDELKIWRVALSAEQIKLNYENRSDKVISSRETKSGETWRVSVTPNDNLSDGTAISGNEILITANTSCKAYKSAGFTEDGIYEIDPDGEGAGEPFEVWCDMTSTNLESESPSSNSSLKSCTHHLALFPSNAGKDGIYMIDPDGANQGKDPFKLWCDMTTDGGGWGLISYLDDEDNSANRWALLHDANDTGLEVGSNATSFDATFRTPNNKLLIEMADEIAVGVPFKDDALVNGFRKLGDWTWAWKLQKPDVLTSAWIDGYNSSNHLISSVNYTIINQPSSGSSFTNEVQNIYYGKKTDASEFGFMLAEDYGSESYFYPAWNSCQETPLFHLYNEDTGGGNSNGLTRGISKSTNQSGHSCKLSGTYATYEYHTNTRAIEGSIWVREDITQYYNPEVSCAAHKALGRNSSGVYKIDPDGAGGIEPFTAYCDMTSTDLITDSESSSTALESCMQHLVYYPDNYTVDGVYMLDPDGTSGSEEPFKVWCDMTREGGGWTHTASLADDQNNYWTWNNQANLYNGNEYGQLNSFRTNDYQSKAWRTVSGNQIMFSHGVNNGKYIIYNDIINGETLNSKYTSSNTTVGEFGPPVVTEGTWWQQRGTELKMHLQVPDSDGHGWAMGGKSFVWRSTANHNSNYDDVFGGTSGAHNPDKEFWAPEHYFFYERNFDASALTVYVRENSLTTAYQAEKSCQHHYLKNRRVNGVYKIDPDGDGDIVEFEAYCDMNTDGGGWTLVHKNNRGSGADNDKTDNGYNTEALSDPVINDVAILPKATIEALGETFRINTDSDIHKMYWRFNSMSDVYYSSRMDDASEPVDLSVNYKLNWSSDWSDGTIDPTNTGTDSHSFVVWTEKDNTDKAHMIVSRNSGSGSSFWFNGDSWSYTYKPGAVWVKNSLLSAPEISYFRTNKNRIERGEDIQLSWSVPNGVTAELYSDTDSNYQTPRDVSSQSSENLTPDSDKAFVTYTLRVTDSDGFINKKKVKIFLDREIPYSLRFNSSESNYLRRENAESGNSKKWTYSVWVKLGDRDVEGTNFRSLFSSGKIGEPTEGSANLYINNSGNLCFNASNDHSNVHADYISTEKIESISEWTHIFVSFNSTEAVEENRFKAYVNGGELSLTSSLPVAENMELVINKEDYMHSIGVFYRNCTSENCDNENNSSIPGGGTDYYPHLFDGYMTEIYFIDGQSLSVNDFGESKSGNWIPKATSVYDYGNNGFYLNFFDQTNPGADYSGNDNDWLLINYVTRKDGDRYIDQMLDSPDRNFAVLNPNDPLNNNSTISYGNISFKGNSYSGASSYSTSVGVSEKQYFEGVRKNSSQAGEVGIIDPLTDNFYSVIICNGEKRGNENGVLKPTTSITSGEVNLDETFSFYLDFENSSISFSRSSGTRELIYNIVQGQYKLYVNDASSVNASEILINGGQGGQSGLKDYKVDITTGIWTEITDGSVPDVRFKYTPPTGFYPLNDAFVSPDISSFTANPTEVNSGGTTDLEWVVTGSVKEELWLDGNKVADITGQSPYTITPPEEPGEYTYTLKSYNGVGLVSIKEVKITVNSGISVESVQINDNNDKYRSNQKLEAVHTGLNPADGNLIYNWFVDRGSGSNTIADVIIPFDGNTVNDKSGNNNNGALHDDENDGFNSNGKYGVGYEFDGVNDYIEMPTIGNMFNSDFSYSIWVYIPSEARTEDVSFFNVRNFDDTGTGDHRAGHIVLQPDDNIRFECKGEGDNVLLEKTKNLSITKDVYLHFVVTKRGNEFRFYYNGEEQPDMRITTTGSTAIDDNNISLGRLNSNTVTGYFKGRVDELMIFDRTLSSGQIKSAYENGMRYIVPSETRVTDKWQVKVIPSNGTNTGEEKQSQQVTITASRRRLIVVETQ
jgi:uncharacterized protein YceK